MIEKHRVLGAGVVTSTPERIHAYVVAEMATWGDAARRAGIRPQQKVTAPTMIHELRIYHCVPGKLPALLNRFETATLKIWARHGIRQAGFWTVAIGASNQVLYYLLEWASLAEREAKWGAFLADPEWHATRARTEADGQIVASVHNEILVPTAFSAVK